MKFCAPKSGVIFQTVIFKIKIRNIIDFFLKYEYNPRFFIYLYIENEQLAAVLLFSRLKKYQNLVTHFKLKGSKN